MTDIKYFLNQHGLQRLSGKETWDYSTLVSLALCTDYFIQRFLRECYQNDLVNALSGDGMGMVTYRVRQNMSLRYAEVFEQELNEATPSDIEITNSRELLAGIFKSQHTQYEQELWSVYQKHLNADVLGTKPDLSFISELPVKKLKHALDCLPIEIGFGSLHDPNWSYLLEIIRSQESDETSDAMYDLFVSSEPLFLWQIELGKRFWTYTVKQL